MTTGVVPRPAFLPASACGHGCLPGPGETPAVDWPTRAVRLAALVAVLLLGLIVALAQPLARGAGVQGWFRLLLRAAGARLVVTGDPRIQPGTLVTGNHVSWLDIPAIAALTRVRVLSKADVRQWPLVGWLAAAGGTLFIDRTRLSSLPATVATVAETLGSGRSVLVFPEGTTWCGRTQGRFYPAAFQAAIDAGAPVQPVHLRFVADSQPTTAAAFVGDDTLLSSVLRVVAIRRLTIEVRLAPPSPGAPVAGPHRAAARRAWAADTAATIRAMGNRADRPGRAAGPRPATQANCGSDSGVNAYAQP